MTIDDKIRDEKLQYNKNSRSKNISIIIIIIDKYEYLAGEGILSFNKRQIIKQGKFAYSHL